MSEGCAFHYDLDLKVTDSMPEENDTLGDKIIELYDEEDHDDDEVDENDFDEWEPTNLSVTNPQRDSKIAPTSRESDLYNRYETPDYNKLKNLVDDRFKNEDQEVQ